MPDSNAAPAPRSAGLFDQPINPDAQRLAQQPPKEPVRVSGTRPLPATNQADMSPQERWQTDQDARSRGDAWLDTTKVLSRDQFGNLVQRERVVGADGEPATGKALDQPDVEAQHTPTGEQGDDEKRIAVGDADFTETEIREALAAKAEADLRKTQLPAFANLYKLELPADFKLPPGADFKLAKITGPVKGPGLIAAQDFAHRHGLSQQAFSEMLGVYAASTAHEQALISQAAQRERAALGAAGPVRVDAVATWLKANFGADANVMLATMVSARQVEAYEKIISRLTNQGGARFSGAGREPPEVPTISDAVWDKMSYTDKINYSREATARANNNGGGRR